MSESKHKHHNHEHHHDDVDNELINVKENQFKDISNNQAHFDRLTMYSRRDNSESTILCCLCGSSIRPNPTSMCFNCLQSQVDITQDFSKEETIFWCRECERYLQPPKYWSRADLESKELLSLCLKRVKGLNKRDLKLVDARFLWTEPHSKRLKVQITIQKEVLPGAEIQQPFAVEFIIKNLQCDTCKTSYTKYDWVASVQVRQKVDHKRTFYFLEQLILKSSQHTNCINIKELPDGLDFYFSSKSHAAKFRDFICSVVPTHVETSKNLVAHDNKSNLFNYKHSYSITIAPLSREDLVCLPPFLSSSMGGLGPVALVRRVNQSIHFLDPRTLKRGEITSALYFKHSFLPLMSSRSLIEYYVLNVEPLESQYPHKKYSLAMAEIVRSDEIGNENAIQFVETHLGNVLNPGDTVLGYDLQGSNFNDNELSDIKQSKIPEVVLVRKVYAKKTRRNFKLKKLPIDKDENKGKEKEDFERFLDEVEEDEEIRAAIRLFKVKNNKESTQQPVTMSKKDKRKAKKSTINEEIKVKESQGKEFLPDIDEEFLESDDESTLGV